MTKNVMGTPRPSPIKPTTAEAFPGNRTAADMRALLAKAARDTFDRAYLIDWSDEWVAVEMWSGDGYGCVQAPYSMTDEGVVTFGDATAVERRTVYTPLPASSAQDTGPALAMESVAHVDTQPVRVLAALADGTDGHRIYRVRMIAAGTSLNGNVYPLQVLAAAARQYEGAQVFDRHRTTAEMASGTTVGLIGQIRNVAATAQGLEGDLHLLPSATHAAEMFDASLDAEAQGLPPLVGLSHDVYGTFKPVSVAGRTLSEATEITSVNSVDMVSRPAAGGAALRAVASIGDPDTPVLEDTMPKPLSEFCEALATASPEEKADLAALLGGAPAATPTPTYGRESLMGRSLIRSAVEAASLPERAATVLATRLPESFTEADLTAGVEAIQAAREAFELDTLTPQVTHVQVTGDERDKKAKSMDAMLAGGPNAAREGAYRSLRHAYLDICGAPKGVDPYSVDLSRAVLREAYHAPVGAARTSESVTTSTFAQILGDSITRRMIAVYTLPSLATWRLIVSSIVPVTDFREQKRDRMGGYGLLPTVNQGAPYQPLTSPDDEEATYSPIKRGGTEDLTLEAITNDDLGALRAVPQRLGRAAAITLYRFVWDFLASNATCTYDTTALFHTNHANTASAALSQANVSSRRTAMRKQAAYGNSVEVLGATPRFLVVPPELEELAFQICTSAVAIPGSGNATDIPNIHQGMQPVVVDYLSDANDWFLVADPASVPTIEVGFLGGQEDPELFVQADPAAAGSHFNADKVTYKIRHIYGGTILDHRGFQRGVQ